MPSGFQLFMCMCWRVVNFKGPATQSPPELVIHTAASRDFLPRQRRQAANNLRQTFTYLPEWPGSIVSGAQEEQEGQALASTGQRHSASFLPEWPVSSWSARQDESNKIGRNSSAFASLVFVSVRMIIFP